MLAKKSAEYLGWAEPTGDDFFINLYNQYTGAGFPLNVAWCAIFVTVIARLCGISTDVVPNFADCDVGVRWFKNHGRWKNSKSQGGNYTPKRNDIVFYSSGHTQSDSTHVGYVVEVSGSTLKAIEGNKSDAVGYRIISLSDPYIIGYGQVADYIGSNSADDDYSDLASYTVKSGDTLSEIAKAMGVSTSDLAAYNGIGDPNVITVGQVIKNPAAREQDMHPTVNWIRETGLRLTARRAAAGCASKRWSMVRSASVGCLSSTLPMIRRHRRSPNRLPAGRPREPQRVPEME